MSFEMFTVLLLAYIAMFIWFVVLEIKSYFLLKRTLQELQPIMQQWVDNYDLTSKEKQYWLNAIKKMSNPLSIMRAMVRVPYKLYTGVAPSAIGKKLQQKNEDLYRKTHEKLNKCFVYSSPTLCTFLILELFLILLFVAFLTIILAIISLISLFVIVLPFKWAKFIYRTVKVRYYNMLRFDRFSNVL